MYVVKLYFEFRDKFVEFFKVNNNIVFRIKISEFLIIFLNFIIIIIGNLDLFLIENVENMIFEFNNLDDVYVGVVIFKLIFKIN